MNGPEKKLEMDIERMLTGTVRPEMLPVPMAVYERRESRYPDRIRVAFDDGCTMVYEIRTEQPAPVIVENIRIIRKWKQGYVNQPERRRKRK